MIKQKFLEVLHWIRDHLHFLVEVVIRLSLGIEKHTTESKSDEEDHQKKGD